MNQPGSQPPNGFESKIINAEVVEPDAIGAIEGSDAGSLEAIEWGTVLSPTTLHGARRSVELLRSTSDEVAQLTGVAYETKKPPEGIPEVITVYPALMIQGNALVTGSAGVLKFDEHAAQAVRVKEQERINREQTEWADELAPQKQQQLAEIEQQIEANPEDNNWSLKHDAERLRREIEQGYTREWKTEDEERAAVVHKAYEEASERQNQEFSFMVAPDRSDSEIIDTKLARALVDILEHPTHLSKRDARLKNLRPTLERFGMPSLFMPMLTSNDVKFSFEADDEVASVAGFDTVCLRSSGQIAEVAFARRSIELLSTFSDGSPLYSVGFDAEYKDGAHVGDARGYGDYPYITHPDDIERIIDRAPLSRQGAYGAIEAVHHSSLILEQTAVQLSQFGIKEVPVGTLIAYAFGVNSFRPIKKTTKNSVTTLEFADSRTSGQLRKIMFNWAENHDLDIPEDASYDQLIEIARTGAMVNVDDIVERFTQSNTFEQHETNLLPADLRDVDPQFATLQSSMGAFVNAVYEVNVIADQTPETSEDVLGVLVKQGVLDSDTARVFADELEPVIDEVTMLLQSMQLVEKAGADTSPIIAAVGNSIMQMFARNEERIRRMMDMRGELLENAQMLLAIVEKTGAQNRSSDEMLGIMSQFIRATELATSSIYPELVQTIRREVVTELGIDLIGVPFDGGQDPTSATLYFSTEEGAAKALEFVQNVLHKHSAAELVPVAYGRNGEDRKTGEPYFSVRIGTEQQSIAIPAEYHLPFEKHHYISKTRGH